MVSLGYDVLSRTISKNLPYVYPGGLRRQGERRKLVSLPSFLNNGDDFWGESGVFIPGLGGWRGKKAAFASKRMLPEPCVSEHSLRPTGKR